MPPFIDYSRERRIPRPDVRIEDFSPFVSEKDLRERAAANKTAALLYQFVLSLKEEAAIHRINTLHAIAGAGSGHPGGSFSAAEIATCLFSVFMKYDSATPYAEQRDRFILSKGHGVPIVYAALAGHGFFPIDELAKLRRLGGLPGHASHVTPGIDAPTGSLGQGLSIAQGIAEAVSCKGIRANVYVVLGDGELQEGQVWEAARVIGAANTRNVIAFIDANGVQQTAPVESVSSVSPIKDKFLAFGWDAIGDDVPWGAPRESGHDFVFLINACSEALTARKPTVVLCSTVKGKGVSFMENKAQWHGKAPKGGEYAQAIEELTASRAAAVEGYEKLKTSL